MTFLKLVRAGFHGLLLFLLPWGVGGLSSLVFDTREVEESSGELTRYFALFTVPLLFAQLVAISVKVGRERRALREAGVRGFRGFVEALDRHAVVLFGGHAREHAQRPLGLRERARLLLEGERAQPG
jgi:hypothetical protein